MRERSTPAGMRPNAQCHDRNTFCGSGAFAAISLPLFQAMCRMRWEWGRLGFAWSCSSVTEDDHHAPRPKASKISFRTDPVVIWLLIWVILVANDPQETLEPGKSIGAAYTFSQPDLIIAATALHHGLTVVTRNVSDYERVRTPVLNPWADRVRP
jgi:hypothetical protein